MHSRSWIIKQVFMNGSLDKKPYAVQFNKESSIHHVTEDCVVCIDSYPADSQSAPRGNKLISNRGINLKSSETNEAIKNHGNY